MTRIKKQVTISTLKRIILFLSVIILINPIILYLISRDLIISILIPSISLIVCFFLYVNKSTKPLFALVFNLFLVLSFFLHAEAIFTFIFSDYIIEDLYKINYRYYFNRPNLNKTFSDKEFVVNYRTNKQGFRIGVEDEPEIEVEHADWLFIGDSYTQGAQVQYEELYTSKLYSFFPNKIIVNAGVSGWGLPDEFHYYVSEGRKLKPKKVFLQVCNFNDFMNVQERYAGFSDYLMHYSNFARYVLYGFKYANPVELPLGRWTEPFYPDKKSNVNYNIFYTPSSKGKQQDIINFEFFLKELNKAVTKDGGELIVLQIPTKEQLYYKYFEEVINSFKIDVGQLNMNLPNELLNRICQENGIRHLDLLEGFLDTQAELFYQFDEHLNSLGHQQLAINIRDFIKNEEVESSTIYLLSGLNTGDRYPNFSMNDCNLMSYQTFKSGNMEIFLADSMLRSIKRITWNNIDEIHPWLSPDNTKIVFTEGNQEENNTKVGIMNIDGSERKYITKDKNTYGAIPSFNYEGSLVAYAEWKQDDQNGYFTNPYIVIYNIKSDEKRIITSDTFENWRPIFSPDNQKVIFISKEFNNQFDLFVYNIASGIKTNITKTDYEEWDPAISRDGKLIVYTARKNNNWDLFLYELETGNIKQLTNSIGNEWDPTFSPCNQYIYYAGTFGLRNGIFRIKIM